MQKKQEKIEASGSDSESDGNLDEQQEMETDEEENASENDEEAGPSESGTSEQSGKKKKRGIIYISSIPKFMNVTILRELLSQYAKLGRVFLQPGKLSGESHTFDLDFCQRDLILMPQRSLSFEHFSGRGKS